MDELSEPVQRQGRLRPALPMLKRGAMLRLRSTQLRIADRRSQNMANNIVASGHLGRILPLNVGVRRRRQRPRVVVCVSDYPYVSTIARSGLQMIATPNCLVGGGSTFGSRDRQHRTSGCPPGRGGVR